MEQYNEKKVKKVEYVVVICLIVFTIFAGLYLKNERIQMIERVQTMQEEKIYMMTTNLFGGTYSTQTNQITPHYHESSTSIECLSALYSAQKYVLTMPLSKQRLYFQLVSPIEGYSHEAAKFAVEHVIVDWDKQAIKSAKVYMQYMPMTRRQLMTQLTSETGEAFTHEQAAYAIANVDKY